MSIMRMILGTPRWSRRLFEVQTTVTWTQVTQTLVHQPLAVVKRTWRLESPRVGDVWPRTLFSGFVRFVHTLSPTLVHTENRQMVLEGKSLLPRMTPSQQIQARSLYLELLAATLDMTLGLKHSSVMLGSPGF